MEHDGRLFLVFLFFLEEEEKKEKSSDIPIKSKIPRNDAWNQIGLEKK